MPLSQLSGNLLPRGNRAIRQLVENRTLYESHGVDLAIYDTYQQADAVQLDAEQVLYCAMVSGKKILHANHDYCAEFLPHQSYVMQPGEQVYIDFPEATTEQPTTCLTLAFSQERLQQMAEQLQRVAPVEAQPGWQNLAQTQLHVCHSAATQQLLNRIVNAFVLKDHDRDLVLNFGVNELILRLVRQYGQQTLLELAHIDPQRNALTAVLDYIENNLHQPISIETLCSIACMSRSKLYQQFAVLADCSPMEYIQQRRLHRAKQLLAEGQSVTQAFLSTGFVNAGHFCRRFQQRFGITPSQYAGVNQRPTLIS